MVDNEIIYVEFKRLINSKVNFEKLVEFILIWFNGHLSQDLLYFSYFSSLLYDVPKIHNKFSHYYWYLRMIVDIFIQQKCKKCRDKSLYILKQYFDENKDKFKNLPIQNTKDIPIIKIKEIKCKYCKLPIKEFKVNEYITLKLENKITNIYVNGIIFNQCKYLVVNIDLSYVEEYDKINSIDDIEKYDRSDLFREYEIDPEMEFWGHCSNLQAWVENDYDTRLLHSNLAFPLLKKLFELGDPVAKRVFKDEIAYRIREGNDKVRDMLVKEYIESDLFTFEEFKMLMFDNRITEKGYKYYTKFEKEFIRGVFPTIQELIISVVYEKLDFSFTNKFFYPLLNTIKKIFDEKNFCIHCFNKRLKKLTVFYEGYKNLYRHIMLGNERKEEVFSLFDIICKDCIIF